MNWVLSLFPGQPVPSVSSIGGNPVASLRLAEATREREIQVIRREPATQRAWERFQRGVEKARSVGEALDDPAVREFLLKALGIPDLANASGLVKRAFLANPAEPNGLHVRLQNPRLTEAARTLKLYEQGLTPLRDAATRQRLQDGWVRAEWFDRLRARDPAVADAILFREQASRFVGSTFGVLADPVMRRVITSTLGLPQELAVMSVEAQARALDARFDTRRLADPVFVERFAQRYVMAVANTQGVISGVSLLGISPLNVRI